MFLLHLHYDGTDRRETLTFPSAWLRGLHVILLATQPVTIRLEDVEAA